MPKMIFGGGFAIFKHFYIQTKCLIFKNHSHIGAYKIEIKVSYIEHRQSGENTVVYGKST